MQIFARHSAVVGHAAGGNSAGKRASFDRSDVLAYFLAPTADAGGRLAALDGLRGAAVLLVVLSHLDNAQIGATPGLNWGGAGKYGVYLFFVLSAFLLTSLLLERPDSEIRSARCWGEYAVRRLLRIYPAYAVVLLAHVAFNRRLGDSVGAPVTMEAVVQHLRLLVGADVFWTIPVECKFYLVLPLVVLLEVLILRRRPLPVVALLLLTIGGVTFYLAPGYDARANPIALAPFLGVFLVGCLTANAQKWISASRTAGSRPLRLGFEVAGWAALAIVLMHVPSIWNTISGGAAGPLDFQIYPVRFGVLWSVCLLATLNGRGALAKLMSLLPLRLVGAISFSLYLWHYMVLTIVQQRLPDRSAAVGWLVIALSLAVATLSYVLIERPALRLARRLVSGRRGTSTVVDTPPDEGS